MKTLSAINAALYEHAARSIKAYHQTILQAFAAFAHRAGGIALHAEEAAEHWILVFGSDHGLCGNYNEALAELVKQHCQVHAQASTPALGKPHLLAMGTKLHDALVDQGLAPERVLLPPASAEGIGRLASEIVTRLDAIGQGQSLHRLAVTLAFTQRGEQSQCEPVMRRLLLRVAWPAAARKTLAFALFARLPHDSRSFAGIPDPQPYLCQRFPRFRRGNGD